MDYWFQQFMNGLAAGSIYALIAVGYSMVYSVLYLINFAHGDVYMFGTFICLALFNAGLPIWLAILLACLAGAAISLLVERIAYRPVRNANRIVPMVSALGTGLVIRSVAQSIWGAGNSGFPQFIPHYLLTIGAVRVGSQQLVSLGVAALMVLVLTLLLRSTQIGRATQCVYQDMEAAQIIGVRINRIIPLIYAVGGLLGVVGGVLFAVTYNSVYFSMGLLGTTKAWAAAMIGGVGNLYGAFVGGLILGVAESLGGALIGSGYKDAVALVAMVAVLMLRPAGLLGRREVERV